MLNFFRTYQRSLFIVVTIVIILSFTFFGTYSAFSGAAEAPDREVCRGVTGRKIMERELNGLIRLIGTSPLDREQGKMPNLLNDSVVQRDLLATGMGMMLARRYFDEIKPDLQERLPRIKQFRPFVHPEARTLSAEAVWQRFHPTLAQHLSLLKAKSDQLTLETVALLFQLYLDQAQFPEDLVRQILSYQANQQGMQADGLLQQADLSLFGFHTLEDWFGPRFVSLATQFIWNAGLYAEENGYAVTREEVRADLYQNIAYGYREIAPQASLSAEEMQTYYHHAVQNLGLNEAQLIDGWKQVILFRRLFQDVGNSVFLDPLPFKQFQSFAKEGVKVDLFELPEALRLSDLRAIFRFQTYLEATSRDLNPVKGSLILPTRYASIEQVEKRAPELVEQQIELEYAQIERSALASEISLKQTWEWETEDGGWNLLKRQFPALAQVQGATVAERYGALEKLEPKERLQIDKFARDQILDQDHQKFSEALSLQEKKSWSGSLRAKGGKLPFSGIKDQAALYDLLKQAPVGEALSSKLTAMTQDGNTYFQIRVVKRSDQKEILTYAAALKDGTLDQMLDARLETAYPEVRRRHAAQFQQKDGSWRPFIEVKEAVGKWVFADHLKQIEESYRSHFGELPGASGDLPSVFYAQHRLFAFVQQAKEAIEQEGMKSQWVRSEVETEGGLENQWQLVHTQRIIERSTSLPYPKDQIFHLSPSAWSAVQVGYGGALAFFRVVGKEETGSLTAEEIDQGQKALALDAKRNLMLLLLDKIQEKQAIQIDPRHV